MNKVGIIRCQQTEDICPATACLSVAGRGRGAFSHTGPSEMVGIVSCGGCPGKRAVARAQKLVDRGADTIALASCIFKGTPIGFSCPHAQTIKEAIRRKLGDDTVLLDYTHP